MLPRNTKRSYLKSACATLLPPQIITFRDYLPLLLGTDFNKQLPLYRGYNDSLDPTVSNVFSLAFRFGHGTIPPLVPRLGPDFKPLQSIPNPSVPLHLTFSASWRIVEEGKIVLIIKSKFVREGK